MSLQITKAGLLDTIQDKGRYGYQHLGINPGGAMDCYASQLANALLGKDLNSQVIEIHYPACEFLFKAETVICITGADFTPTINRKKIELNRPVAVNNQTELRFEKKIAGARCYVSFLQELDVEKWLNSYSTNLMANAGGFMGRALQKGDELIFTHQLIWRHLPEGKDFKQLTWTAGTTIQLKQQIRFIKGSEWNWLTHDAKESFGKNTYKISNNSNRMGYRLEGNALQANNDKQLVSSGVTFGTIQLLPDGQLIILMADHQTTGGYPRIGHVISADLPLLAQQNPGDEIEFSEIEQTVAEMEFIHLQRDLLLIKTASQFKIENLLHEMRSEL